MSYFEGKTAWVSGASSGIGKAICEALAEAGATVVLSARNAAGLETVLRGLKHPEKHTVLPLDLEQSGQFVELAAQVVAKHGRIDFLFNNGGLSQRSEAAETPLEIDRRIMEINYFGNIALAKAVLPYLQQQQSGHLVITSSIAGKFGFYLRSAYSASKHALHGFYESVALEEAKNNIFVTVACPGKINTPISTHALTADGQQHGVMDHNQETGMPAAKCAAILLKAVAQQKREILIGNKEIKAVTLKRFLPNLFWKIIKKQSAT
jgi:dehydrogenase/reductase SDR family protein 7B